MPSSASAFPLIVKCSVNFNQHLFVGGFLAGLIIPHDNGYAISIVEKIEDLVTILFLPIVRLSFYSVIAMLMNIQYFTLSGLKTDLSLLDNGITWGYIILICTVAFLSKFLSSGIAAYVNGFNWRESSAIGSLMSCKGYFHFSFHVHPLA